MQPAWPLPTGTSGPLAAAAAAAGPSLGLPRAYIVEAAFRLQRENAVAAAATKAPAAGGEGFNVALSKRARRKIDSSGHWQKLTATTVPRPPVLTPIASYATARGPWSPCPRALHAQKPSRLAWTQSVSVPNRGGAYAALCWAGREESAFGSFDVLRPAQVASDLVDCY